MNAKINTRLFSTAFFEANNGTAYHKALAQFEKPLLQEVMTECRGNQTRAAEILGLNRGTFRKKLIQHGLHK